MEPTPSAPVKRRQYPLGDHGLSYVIFGLFIASWGAQFVSQLVHVGNEAREHGQQFSMSEFWPQFLSSTFENWQSEFLQVFTFVVLTAYLVHRGSSESKDGDDEMKDTLERIERRLDAMEASMGGGEPRDGDGAPVSAGVARDSNGAIRLP